MNTIFNYADLTALTRNTLTGLLTVLTLFLTYLFIETGSRTLPRRRCLPRVEFFSPNESATLHPGSLATRRRRRKADRDNSAFSGCFRQLSGRRRRRRFSFDRCAGRTACSTCPTPVSYTLARWTRTAVSALLELNDRD